MDKDTIMQKYNQLVMEYGKASLDIEDKKRYLLTLQGELTKTVGILQDILKEEEAVRKNTPTTPVELGKKVEKLKAEEAAKKTASVKPEAKKDNVIPIKKETKSEKEDTKPKAS